MPKTISRVVDPSIVRIVELTAFDARRAQELFDRHATHTERSRAARLPPERSAVFRRAHGALHARLAANPVPHWSLSYARSRAWAVFASTPVGLDVVSGEDNRPLDLAFANSAECAMAAAFVPAFPAQLSVWAAKEACAKLTGDVRREPEGWRLQMWNGQCGVENDLGLAAIIHYVRLASDLLAAVARGPHEARTVAAAI